MTRIVEDLVVRMTSKGQIFVPKALRERAGLAVGQPARLRLNAANQVVVLPGDPRATETLDEKRTRIHAGLLAILGKFADGRSTDEKMREMRGDIEL